jgi:O-methyltransferase
MMGVRRMDNLHWACRTVLEGNVPGDFVEAGVWRGGAGILMRAALSAYGDPARRVILADSFEGLPKPNPDLYPADANDAFWTFPQLAVSLEEVRENFDRYGLLDDRVVFLKGWFKDTLSTAPTERIALLRLDGDMYESTWQALEALYPRCAPGAVVIIDDYGCVPACRAAVSDYRAQHGIDAPIETVDWTGVFWRTPF